MKLFTQEILKAFEKQGYTGEKKPSEIKVICKLFNPCGAGTWYLYEREDENIHWGFVNLNDPQMAECGTVSLDELRSIKCPPLNLPIERDMHFPVGKYTLQEVIDKIKAGGHI